MICKFHVNLGVVMNFCSSYKCACAVEFSRIYRESMEEQEGFTNGKGPEIQGKIYTLYFNTVVYIFVQLYFYIQYTRL